MKSSYLSLVLSLLPLFGSSSVYGKPEDNFAFETFLMVQLRNYSDWLVSSKLDPSPVVPYVIDVIDDYSPIWNLTGKIWNQRLANHSNIYSWEVVADLEKFELEVYLDFVIFTMTGEYEVGGDFWNETVTGSGTGEITATPTAMFGGPYLRVTFKNFGVTTDDYVDLSKAVIVQKYIATHSGTFEGLDAGGEENRVGGKLATEQLYTFEDWNPLAGYLEKYLQQILDETPLSDIIGSK